jgi:hypothetical protein
MGHGIGVMEQQIADDALNIFFEHFTDEHVALLESRPDVKYAIIQTELMTGETFNNDNYFRKRYRNFMRLAKRAQFVINMVGDTKVPCPHFKVEPGYAPQLEAKKNDHLIENDLYFFGTMSHRREELLYQLTAAGLTVRVSTGASMQERDMEIQKCRYVLGLRCHWPVDFPSLTRISAALHGQRPVIYEQTVGDPVIGAIPLIHDTKEDFADYVVRHCKDVKGWKKVRQQQLTMFHSFPIERCFKLAMLEAGITL